MAVVDCILPSQIWQPSDGGIQSWEIAPHEMKSKVIKKM
jgi:hypothetical protein